MKIAKDVNGDDLIDEQWYWGRSSVDGRIEPVLPDLRGDIWFFNTFDEIYSIGSFDALIKMEDPKPLFEGVEPCL
jgi:hypothetical protein